MERKIFLSSVFLLLNLGICWAEPFSIDLAGEWNYRLDPTDVGMEQEWYREEFTETLNLPGSLNTNGIGDVVDAHTPWTGKMWNNAWYESDAYAKYREAGNVKPVFWLTPDYYYVGRTWYQKTIEIPKEWAKRKVILHLERCHWETTLWVDQEKIGSQNSLSVPHRYLLENLSAGKHILTLCIDNRVKDIDPGVDAHSISDNTQSNWNGVIGDLSLEAVPKAHVERVAIFPDMDHRKIEVRVWVNLSNEAPLKGKVRLKVKPLNSPGNKLVEQSQKVKLAPGLNELVVTYDMAADFRLWNEFSPNLYELTAVLDTKFGRDTCVENFGLRELGTHGTQITVNGRPVFLRGTLECCIFPKTGFPPTDELEWERIMRICKSYGLNHIRFHSWCPPEAAFDAADRVGLYLYVECCAWANVGYGKPIDKFIREESVRIVDEYGNHPSFCMLSYGNEPWGDNREAYLRDFVNFWKARDSRFLYTTGAGWPAIDESDWISTGAPRIQSWGQGVKSVINGEIPNTEYDWKSKISTKQPTVSHEIGQWCVYPDLKERNQYTGAFKAKNFDIFEDRLRENGLLHLADSFLLASGKLQTLCYKADIEAALRTEGFGGFQLLDLHDFPGQGSALVGVLNAFWREKGYVTAQEYREFCNQVVPLARMSRLIYNSGDTLSARIQVAQFAASDMTAPVSWKVVNGNGEVVKSGCFPVQKIPTGGLSSIGTIWEILSVDEPSQWQLVVSVGEYTNRWNLWVYPQEPVEAKEVLVADGLSEKMLRHLNDGGKILLTPKLGALRNEGCDSVVVGFSSIFWNTLWTNNQAPHTLGVLCNPGHPALNLFPTSYHSDYQWQDILSHCNAISLKTIGNIQPVVRIIDDWFTARPFGLIVEMKVGNGSVLLCGADLLTDMENRPAARQLLTSLLAYMNSSDYRPTQKVELDSLRRLFN